MKNHQNDGSCGLSVKEENDYVGKTCLTSYLFETISKIILDPNTGAAPL